MSKNPMLKHENALLEMYYRNREGRGVFTVYRLKNDLAWSKSVSSRILEELRTLEFVHHFYTIHRNSSSGTLWKHNYYISDKGEAFLRLRGFRLDEYGKVKQSDNL